MELRVYLGVDPVSGKQRYASRTVRAGKREAQRVLNERITEAERGLAVRRSASVGELLEAWFELASGDFSPSTVKETRGCPFSGRCRCRGSGRATSTSATGA
jgi:hypothetical protein